MSNVIPVVAVTDESTGSEALYVAGSLARQECKLHMVDVAECVAGKAITFRHECVYLPHGVDFPESLEECLKYQVNEAEGAS